MDYRQLAEKYGEQLADDLSQDNIAAIFEEVTATASAEIAQQQEDIRILTSWLMSDDKGRALLESVADEREACAKIADLYAEDACNESSDASVIADAIRARGKTPSLFLSAPVTDHAENKPSSKEEMDKSAQIVRELIVSEIAPVLDHLPSPHPTVPKETFLMDGNEHTKGPDCHCSPTICRKNGCDGYLHHEPVYGPSFAHVCEKCELEE